MKDGEIVNKISTPQELKESKGKGFNLRLKLNPDVKNAQETEDVIKTVKELFPASLLMKDSNEVSVIVIVKSEIKRNIK